MITGHDHLEKLVTDIIHWSTQAGIGWLREDQASAMPRSGDGTGGSQGPANPVAQLVAAGRRTGSRDRIGSKILHVHQVLRDLHLELTPRAPSRVCRCCKTEMATTAPDAAGEWTACPACDRYQREWNTRCPDEVHRGRPQVRMCECSADCCEPGTCPDRAAEGRTVSERCLKRQYRARHQAG